MYSWIHLFLIEEIQSCSFASAMGIDGCCLELQCYTFFFSNFICVCVCVNGEKELNEIKNIFFLSISWDLSQ